MITEDYISFETEELLKKVTDENVAFEHYIQKNNDDGTSEAVAVCTQQIAMKFMRKAYFLNISPQFNRWENNWSVVIRSMDNRNIIKNNPALEMSGFSSYEDSVEAALQYCLKNFI